jgi:hypothetical protein
MLHWLRECSLFLQEDLVKVGIPQPEVTSVVKWRHANVTMTLHQLMTSHPTERGYCSACAWSKDITSCMCSNWILSGIPEGIMEPSSQKRLFLAFISWYMYGISLCVCVGNILSGILFLVHGWRRGNIHCVSQMCMCKSTCVGSPITWLLIFHVTISLHIHVKGLTSDELCHTVTFYLLQRNPLLLEAHCPWSNTCSIHHTWTWCIQSASMLSIWQRCITIQAQSDYGIITLIRVYESQYQKGTSCCVWVSLEDL